jgi:hypothetical protein
VFYGRGNKVRWILLSSFDDAEEVISTDPAGFSAQHYN